MSASKKSFYILIAGVIFLLALIFVSWLFYSKIDGESKLMSDASAQIALVQEKEREFDESSANLQKYDAEIQKLRKAFLNESSFVDFLEGIESIARKADVEFKAVSAALPTSENDSAIFSFRIEGTETALVRFFALLDKVPYSGIVQGMQWTRQGKASDKIVVTGEYVIFNYIK